MKFTQRFNEILKISGKTQSQIARALHLSKQTVNDYKTGKSFPSLETLFLLCEFLEISSDYLLGLSDF